MGPSSWGPKDSVERKEAAAPERPQRGQALAQPQPPASTFRAKCKAAWTHVRHAQKKTRRGPFWKKQKTGK